jgi:hypothetical protein
MNHERIVNDMENLIRHSGSPLNLKDGLRKLLDAYIMLWDENAAMRERINEAEFDGPVDGPELPII